MISKKVEYMKIAAALCDFHIGEKELDLLVGVYELVVEEMGDEWGRVSFRLDRELIEEYPAIFMYSTFLLIIFYPLSFFNCSHHFVLIN